MKKEIDIMRTKVTFNNDLEFEYRYCTLRTPNAEIWNKLYSYIESETMWDMDAILEMEIEDENGYELQFCISKGEPLTKKEFKQEVRRLVKEFKAL